MMIKVSIIVPVYNVEQYLQVCIDSVIRQTYSDLEILLIDDGSKDNSAQICDEYAERDHRIRVVHKENGGLSDARNVGIELATGGRIFFLDSDDYLSDTAIESLVHLAEQNDAEVVIGSYKKISQYEIPENICGTSKIYQGGSGIVELYDNQKIDATVAWAKLYDAKLVKNMRFPVGKIHEDEFVTYKILYAAKRIVYTDQIIYYYLQRPGSIMNSILSSRELDLMQMCEETVSFYEQKQETVLWKRSMQRALFLSKMLVNLYDDADNEKDREKAYHFFCRYWKKYHGCVNISFAKYLYYFFFSIDYRLGNFVGRGLQKIDKSCLE